MCWRWLLVPAWAVACTAAAQEYPDTVRLDDVVISAERATSFGAGAKLQALDSLALLRNRFGGLGDLLRDAGPMFVKSYAPGGLATTSFRGGAAGHTAVVWNGFNLNSTMNGQLDLSLIPSFLADEVAVQYGGAAALWGSGAVGGAVLLNSKPAYGQGLSVEAGISVGSFSDLRQQLGITFGTAKWSGTLKAYRATAQNDFPFRTSAPGENHMARMPNAAFSQHGIIAGNHFRIGQCQRLNVMIWLDDAERQVPPTLMQSNTGDHQHDHSIRATSEWQRTGARTNLFARAGWFDERLWWYGQESDSGAFSRARTLTAETEARFSPGAGQLLALGLNHVHAEALADGYPHGPSEERSALFAAYRYRSATAKWNAGASIRQEAVQGAWVPFTWTLGADHALLRSLKAKVNLARVYRNPTFNDRYWQPGGNPQLQPESGYSGEVGAAFATRWRNLHLSGEATWFQRRMDHWIIWLPEGGYWTPQNLMLVWSRGVETQAALRWTLGQSRLSLTAMTNYVVSTNERAKGTNDASVGKQLIYVPMYSGHGRLGLQRKKLAAALGIHYTGYRYVSADNRQFLPPYTLVDASASYRVHTGNRTSWTVALQADNLLAEQYQVMHSRPMPLRSVRLSLSMHFHQPIKSEEQP